MKENTKLIEKLYQQKYKMSGGDPLGHIFTSPSIFQTLKKSISKSLPIILNTKNGKTKKNYIQNVFEEKKKIIENKKTSGKNQKLNTNTLVNTLIKNVTFHNRLKKPILKPIQAEANAERLKKEANQTQQ
jgi:hypothetical protein